MAESERVALALLMRQELLRSAVRLCLEHTGQFRVVHASALDEAGLQAAAAVPAPALVMAALCSGTEAEPPPDVLAWLVEHWASGRVLALTEGYEPELVHRAVAAGCTGVFCTRTGSMRELAPALRQLYTGQSYLPPGALRALGQPVRPRPESALERVLRLCTEQEMKVIDLVCAPDNPGWEAVAARAFVSTKTVEGHYVRIYKQLALNSKSALVAFARPLGFGQGSWGGRKTGGT